MEGKTVDTAVQPVLKEAKSLQRHEIFVIITCQSLAFQILKTSYMPYSLAIILHWPAPTVQNEHVFACI
jgi:hypothetical protein